MTTDLVDSTIAPKATTRPSWAVPSEREVAPEESAAVEASSVGLPRHIPGGFLGVAEDLERRSRDWTMMVRLLEQQRLQLETAENERTRLYAALEAVLPAALTTGRAVDDAIQTTKQGDVSANLSALFVENLRELDKLENIAAALTASLLSTRSTWEQYARSVIGAQKMRDDLRA
jgi:hypothetical protein